MTEMTRKVSLDWFIAGAGRQNMFTLATSSYNSNLQSWGRKDITINFGALLLECNISNQATDSKL